MANINTTKISQIRNIIIGLNLFDQMTRAFFEASSMDTDNEMPSEIRDLNRLEDNNLDALVELRTWAGENLREMFEQMTIPTGEYELLGFQLGYFISQEDDGEELTWDNALGDFVSDEQ